MYKVNGEMSSCDITYSGRVPSREGDILLLNGLSKSAQTFTVGFVKLLSTHPIHIVVWGNFPFNWGADKQKKKNKKVLTSKRECCS